METIRSATKFKLANENIQILLLIIIQPTIMFCSLCPCTKQILF